MFNCVNNMCQRLTMDAICLFFLMAVAELPLWAYAAIAVALLVLILALAGSVLAYTKQCHVLIPARYVMFISNINNIK